MRGKKIIPSLQPTHLSAVSSVRNASSTADTMVYFFDNLKIDWALAEIVGLDLLNSAAPFAERQEAIRLLGLTTLPFVPHNSGAHVMEDAIFVRSKGQYAAGGTSQMLRIVPRHRMFSRIETISPEELVVSSLDGSQLRLPNSIEHLRPVPGDVVDIRFKATDTSGVRIGPQIIRYRPEKSWDDVLRESDATAATIQ